MNASAKIRVIKDYDALDEAVQEQVKLAYPRGFSKHLIEFVNREGKRVKALRFETDEKIYLVRMTIAEAKEIIEQDDDFDDDGLLRDDVRSEYEDKYLEDEDLGIGVVDELADDREEDDFSDDSDESSDQEED